jgi:hypothetical protein
VTIARRHAMWKRAIYLKDLLSTDGTPEGARTAARGFADRLKRQPGYEPGGLDDFSQIVDEFDGIAESTPGDYTGEDQTVRGHFNAVLSALYDWADAERVWIS